MKSSKQLRPSAPPRETEAAPTTALTVRACEIIFPQGVETLGEKADFLHAYSVEASKRSTGAAILAGWVLSVARSTCVHGQWMQWLEQNVSFSHQTAQNYLSLYAQTLGARRAAMRRPIALDVQPTEDELEAAAHDVDGKSLSALYKSTRLIKASDNWGGSRKGAGCKKKSEAAAVGEKLDEIANNETLLWQALKGALDTLVKMDSEKDVWNRLKDDHLATAVGILADVAKKSSNTMMKRIGK